VKNPKGLLTIGIIPYRFNSYCLKKPVEVSERQKLASKEKRKLTIKVSSLFLLGSLRSI
jgi:hypothetical protein